MKTEKPAKPKSSHYVDKKEFLKAIVEYKKLCRLAKKEKKPKPKLSNYLGQCIMLIANNLANSPSFFKYTYKDEMIDDAIENCLMYFDNFDQKISKNPFAYFTQICYYAFVRRIHKEKKEQYTKYKIAQQSGIIEELIYGSDEEGGESRQVELYENIQEFISKYEEKKNNKKTKKTVKRGKIEEFME